jgi:hypothetical protein
LLGWVLGLVAIYAALFGTGAYLYGQVPQGVVYTVTLIGAVAGLVRLTTTIWDKLSTPPTGSTLAVVDS